MSALKKIALANMLLMSMLPERTETEIDREEEKANRAIAEGRLNPYEIQREVDEAIKPLVQAEITKRAIVVYYTDENGQIKRKKEYSEEKE